jgi:cystathionine beta-lyase
MHWRTRLIQAEPRASREFNSLTTPTYRASTVVFDSMAQVSDEWNQEDCGYTYGLYGTPTTLELAARISEIEGAFHTFITPGGQAAISLIYFSFCSAGSHVLLPRNAYTPNREFAEGIAQRCGITVERYDPAIGADIAALIRPETTLIWCESPGSITMEVQDVPAIVAAAHARNVPVALDNTYSAGVFFDAFAHGVDVSMQALTKYIGGHSDLLLGSVSAGNEQALARIGDAHRQLGMGASPDDCALALRGFQTLAVRLDALERSTLTVAQWLAERPEIDRVLHPALPGSPGHELWKRDFTGSSSLFSILFKPEFTPGQVNRFVDTLELFQIGWSWGGVTSLAMAYPGLNRLSPKYHGRLVRLNIGLEAPADLIADLESAFAKISKL